MSLPFSTAFFRLSLINDIAFSAQASVIGLATVDTYASIACVSASIPVAAVSDFGIPAISLGSFTAIIGVTCLSTIAIFICLSSSVIIENLVISEAVPAVVFIATKGIWGFSDLSSPS